jgi:lipopolysaccharide export system permease protein
MINALDRYILRRIVGIAVAMIGIALLALLLERLLRLLNLAAHPDQILSYVSQMLITLIPHYLGVATPLAFFLAIIITFNRLDRDKELAVMTAAGIGLQRVMAPVLGLAVLLAVLVGITFSHLQPIGRYTYRSLVHAVAQASLSAAVKGGTFIHVNNLTFIAEKTSLDGDQLDKVFVYEQKPIGTALVTTAKEGSLRKGSGEQDSILVLGDGWRTEFTANNAGARQLQFGHFTWPVPSSANLVFRARGEDERELTLPELWAARDAPPDGIKPNEIISELHGRMVKIMTILVLPFLAVPLSLGGGRVGQSYGLGVGLLILILYEKVLQFGESMVENGHFSPWPGLWLPFAVFSLLGIGLCYRAAFKVPRGQLAALPSPTMVLFWIRRRLYGVLRRGAA